MELGLAGSGWRSADSVIYLRPIVGCGVVILDSHRLDSGFLLILPFDKSEKFLIL